VDQETGEDLAKKQQAPSPAEGGQQPEIPQSHAGA
jgi:hypothetical protein